MLEVNVTMFCRDCEEIEGDETVRATKRQSRSESVIVGGCLTPRLHVLMYV